MTTKRATIRESEKLRETIGDRGGIVVHAAHSDERIGWISQDEEYGHGPASPEEIQEQADATSWSRGQEVPVFFCRSTIYIIFVAAATEDEACRIVREHTDR